MLSNQVHRENSQIPDKFCHCLGQTHKSQIVFHGHTTYTSDHPKSGLFRIYHPKSGLSRKFPHSSYKLPSSITNPQEPIFSSYPCSICNKTAFSRQWSNILQTFQGKMGKIRNLRIIWGCSSSFFIENFCSF